jgi:hypothetical protein
VPIADIGERFVSAEKGVAGNRPSVMLHCIIYVAMHNDAC